MSIAACLVKLVEEGKLDAERAQRWREEYERLTKQYSKTMGEVAAAEAASRDLVDAIDHRQTVEHRQTLLQIKTQMGLLDRVRDHIEAGGKASHVATSIMEHREAAAGHPAVENVRGALYRLAWSKMAGFLSRYERDLLGRVRHGDELREVVKALRGEHTENASAREMADAIGQTFEWLRQQFNIAGGDIPMLKGWGLSQSHDALGVAQAGFEAWWEFHRPLLDPARMIDASTGKPFANEEALREAGEYAWRAIASNGMDGRVPGSFQGSGKLANRRADHRFFIYKDAEAWLAYNDRFGTSDPFDAIIGHLDGMTRDIAAMQVLGPNPAQTVRWLQDLMQQDALPTVAGGKAIKLEKNAKAGAVALGDMYDYYSGAMTAIAPENRAKARFFSGIRNWNVATKLGSAFISALPTDPVFMGMTARFNGLPVMQEIGDYLKLFNPADKSHRAVAESAGLIFSDMTSRAERMFHEGRGFNLHELTRRGADAVMRTSLLSSHTVAAKQSLGIGFMRDWAEHVDRAFDSLEAPKRMALERYGITAKDWDALRAQPVFEQDGQRLLRPGDLARNGGDDGLATAIKFMSLIDSETRFGVPGESLRAQAAVATFGHSTRLRRGTVPGEILHSMNQFKTYSAIMIMTYLERALYGRGGMSKTAYALALPTFLTIGGYLSNVMNDVWQGKDPEPMMSELSLARAVVRGGGLGIIGDLAANGFSDQHGGPITSFITGPTLGGVIDPLVSLVGGNLVKSAGDKDTNFEAQGWRWLRAAVPGNNIWYARLAYNRLWADQLQAAVDPHYAQSWSRMEQRAREQGTQFWWAPGSAAPDRAPNLSNATQNAGVAP